MHLRPTTATRGGYSLIELMFVVAVIGVLLSIALPSFVRAREASAQTACIVNLRQIDYAKTLWVFEQKKEPEDIPKDADLFGPGKFVVRKPSCPSGGTYVLRAVKYRAACTVFGHAVE